MKAYFEKNKETLAGAIADLPAYTAPDHIWDKLESSLENQERFRSALEQLPEHRPPPAVWENIDQALDVPVPGKHPFRYRLLQGTRSRIAAAILCGLAIGLWWFLNTEAPAKTSIVHSVEIQARVNFNEDWHDEESQIAAVMAQVERSAVANPQMVKRLKLEYTELTDARSEVEAMMERYGQDEGLLKEVARIERERSKVIKELAAWI